jgi:NTE family protein
MADTLIPDKQRALILQGGGALGAYDAGVIQVLIEELPKIDAEKNEGNRPIFDIIAGTSSGAINAALLVSHFRDTMTWNGATKKLVDFWNDSSFNTEEEIDFWIHWWNDEHNGDSMAASYESARRYYSAKYFLQQGARGVFSKPEMVIDKRFFDNGSFPNNIWFQYKNDGLREKIKSFGFPIKTNRGQPRLLLVSTNLKDGATITFDSYSTKSEFGRYRKEFDKYMKGTLEYPRGIEPEHVIASASVPLFYESEKIGKEEFCDGGVLSNTPLREVLQAHRDYWYKVVSQSKAGAKVPDLEIYIVSVWPQAENSENDIPTDYDGVKERLYDIALSDKTEHDEKTAMIVSDLVDMVNKITSIALSNLKDKDNKKDFMEAHKKLLASKAQSRGRDGEKRNYESLIQGRARLAGDIVRIECKADIDSISNKLYDLSQITIQKLIAQGAEDAKDVLAKIQKMDKRET